MVDIVKFSLLVSVLAKVNSLLGAVLVTVTDCVEDCSLLDMTLKIIDVEVI